MTYRKLRISWSAACGILCLLVIWLWVRSYTWMDTAVLFGNLPLTSYRGQILCNKPAGFIFTGPTPPPRFSYSYGISSIRHKQLGMNIGDGGLALPHWLVAALIAAAGTASWFRWRFRLRTLLIAITLAAVALALFVYLNRPPTAPPLDHGDFPIDGEP